jgi:nitrogenase molybdenum-iron protein alpha/beta subunit
MNLKPLPTHTSRSGGCTLTGALSVTTEVRDAVSIIHGPRGCAHHNFSLLHATTLDNEQAALPHLVSSALEESDIIFGGEDALARAILSVCEQNVSTVFVLSTCIAGTIGDDVDAVCGRGWPVPVIPVPTAGFLGGTFQNGVNNALIALTVFSEPSMAGPWVNIIGEKNLEYEVEENYAEVVRLLTLLHLPVGLRFVRSISLDDIPVLGAAQLNILRDPSLISVGDYLLQRFGTPYIPSFPAGLSDTLAFICSVAAACRIDPRQALGTEQAFQAEVLADFADICDSQGIFCGPIMDPESSRAVREAATALRIRVSGDNRACPLPVHPVVGTSGVRRMLHRWRRAIHA